MQEIQGGSLGQEDYPPLHPVKEMATQSSSLAGEQRNLEAYSPWGHKRVRQDLVTKQRQKIIWYY